MNTELPFAVRDVSLSDSLPDDCNEGLWVGRAWLPAEQSACGVAGPHIITASAGMVYDLSSSVSTLTDLLAAADPFAVARNHDEAAICSLATLLDNSLFYRRAENILEQDQPCLLAPNDIQAVKACGVTFVESLLERVIEEKAHGNAALASSIRATIQATVGDNLSDIKPGSEATQKLKQEFIEQGLWSPYLEVGIGPDAEVFTKCQPLSSIGTGAELGILSCSDWNNPEPEIAILVTPAGQIIGATLANDVNLRDIEGRSSLLLGKAKDQNGSCVLGPLFRLFDDSFSLQDIEEAVVSLQIHGNDGFSATGQNRMSNISRSPTEIVTQVCSPSHQYPDGVVILLGTMFAPTEDRDATGQGFTHKLGDRVEISSAKLGKLVNWVNHCDQIPQWTYGFSELSKFLGQRAIRLIAN